MTFVKTKGESMKTALALLLAVSLIAPVAAQNAIMDIHKKADEMSAPLHDIEARYWAQRVQSGDPTIEQLEESSKHWVGTKEANKKLIDSVKKYLKSGKKITVTKEEYNRMRENNSKVGDFIKKNSKTAKEQRDQQIDELEAPVRDIRARIFAKQVQDRLTTMKQLEESSKNWLGSDKANKDTLDLIKKYVKAGKPIKVTAEEMAKFNESNSKVRDFLNIGKKDSANKHEKSANNKKEDTKELTFAEKMDKINKIQMSVIDLEARSWAKRIADGNDITLEQLSEKSKGWIGKKEYKEKLLKKIGKYIEKGKIKPLTDKETDKLNQATLDIREILK